MAPLCNSERKVKTDWFSFENGAVLTGPTIYLTIILGARALESQRMKNGEKELR